MTKGWMLSVFSCGCMLAAGLSQGERDRAMSELHATRKQLLDAVNGLTDAQLKWKAAPEKWSVLEVAEHLAVTEQEVFGMVAQSLKGPGDAEKRVGIKVKDEDILRMVPDRSRKFQAPETIRPTGRWKTIGDLLQEFKARRDRTIEFVEKTPADLRNYVLPHPAFGPIDAYQWMLLLAGHTERHVKQIREALEEQRAARSK